MPTRCGLAGLHPRIKTLMKWMARENPGWGYRGIHGELAGLGIKVAASTMWEMLKAAGVDPAPDRDAGPTWVAFLRSQAEAFIAAGSGCSVRPSTRRPTGSSSRPEAC